MSSNPKKMLSTDGKSAADAIEAMNRSMLADVPDHLADRIAERTDGVPLFVEELTRSILESGTSMSLNVTSRPALKLIAS